MKANKVLISAIAISVLAQGSASAALLNINMPWNKYKNKNSIESIKEETTKEQKKIENTETPVFQIFNFGEGSNKDKVRKMKKDADGNFVEETDEDLLLEQQETSEEPTEAEMMETSETETTEDDTQSSTESEGEYQDILPVNTQEGEAPATTEETTEQEVQTEEAPAVFTQQESQAQTQQQNYIPVKDIQISGNSLVKTEDILNAMSTKPGMPYSKEQVKVNLREIYNMGYFTSKIKAVPTVTETGVILQIQVEENLPITEFIVTGNEVVSTKEIQRILESQVGMPQNIVTINKAINDIEGYYAKQGYILARVMNIYDKPDGSIFVEINEGMIDEIKYSGNTKTKDYVIANNLSVTPNTVYNDNLMQRDIVRLYNTQAFGNVKRSLAPSEKDPSKYCLTVEVEEKRTGSISIGGGLDLTTGLFGTLGYSDKNFLGRGQQTSISFSTGTGAMMGGDDVLDKADFQAEAKFIEPRLLGSMTSMDITAFGTSWASFQVPLATEQRYGANISFHRPLKKFPHMAAGITFGAEYDKVKEGDAAHAENLFKSAGVDFARRAEQIDSGLFLSVSPNITFDNRDNVMMPRSGMFVMANLKGAASVVNNNDMYLAATGTMKKYFPIAKKSTLVASARAGGKLVGDMPEFASYRLGGARAVRGFKEGRVGRGYGYVSGSLEYRTPIPFVDRITSNQFINNTRFAAFVDAGQIISPSLTQDLYRWPGYAVSAGIGLRFLVPGLGPLSIDYGVPITNPGPGNPNGGQFTFFFGEAY